MEKMKIFERIDQQLLSVIYNEIIEVHLGDI